MQRTLCIHGHFYQPPREDPWLREILPEGSAAPGLHWNERICRESYAPLGWARRLDGSGRITEILNCYSWMSFNFGPTLLSWLERGNPQTYARILQGDRESQARWGHGNAMAQVYHHIIMPLATPQDRQVETAWGLQDFAARFGRQAEGMWPAEAAVDTATLEVMAEQGVRFVVLAPRQAQAVAPLDGGEWSPVDEGSLDVSQAYTLQLPSGRSLAVFFYHGPLSQAVAFERLLENGENFWRRLSGFFTERGNSSPVFLPLATDGETYGHHFPFGEMALAYVLAQSFFGRDQISLGNFGSWLAQRPPQLRVRLHEPSSWSCVHGVERWRADCGCSTGGHWGWNQKWRGPLRRGLDGLKVALDAHYHKLGATLFRDPTQALLAYGKVLAGSEEQGRFALQHCRKGLGAAQHQAAWRLLAMQHWALASFASCAWFFDEISRIEPMNGLTYALRAMELCEATGGPAVEALEAPLLTELAKAMSNMPELGSGKELYESAVRPRRESVASLGVQALLSLQFEERGPTPAPASVTWPGVRVELWSDKEASPQAEATAPLEGGLALAWVLEHQEERFRWRWEPDAQGDPLGGRFTVVPAGESLDGRSAYRPADLPWNKLQALNLTLAAAVEARDWEVLERRLRPCPQLFLPFQEAQQTQNQEVHWRRLWPVLAWLYVKGLDLPRGGRISGVRSGGLESLAQFLAAQARNRPDTEALSRRIAAHVLELLAGEPPLWESALRMVERTQALELAVDWWGVQNRVRELDPKGKAGRAAQALAERVNLALG